MKKKFTSKHFTGFNRMSGKNLIVNLFIFFILIFTGCVDFEEPAALNDPKEWDTSNDPVITSISPDAIATGGIREIKIAGNNLGIKNNTDTPWVFIGGVRGQIKEILPNEITIYRPNLSEDHYDSQIFVNVTDPNAINTSSNLEYAVEDPGDVLGDYGGAFCANVILSGDLDQNENLFVATSRAVWRNDPTGNTLTVMASNFTPAAAFRSITDAKFGPGGGSNGLNMYLSNGTNTIYRVLLADSTIVGTTRPTAVDTVGGPVSELDFDQNGNLYSVGSGGLFFTNLTDGSTSSSLGYNGITNVKGIRIFNGYVYVADSLNIWRSQISGTSIVGQESLVDLAAFSSFSNCIISSFDLDADGNIVMCIRNYPGYSLFIRESDGSVTPFYEVASILPSTADQVIWGNSRQLYLMSGSLRATPPLTGYASARVFRMSYNKNGAPHLGRNFLE
jgi:hypothetical protein